MALTAAKIKKLKEPGRYLDSNGLYMNIAPGGSKNWIIRITIDRKRTDKGLGGYPSVSLETAREKAADYRKAVKEGRDPTEKIDRPKIPSFREATLEHFSFLKATFNSEKHGKNWIQMMEKYAFPALADMPLDRIDRKQIVDNVLTPIWKEKPETARRVRQRIKAVFDWGIEKEHIATNPLAASLKQSLPAMPKGREHFKALPYQEVPAALKIIRGSSAGLATRLALEFTILTAARSGETRGATWAEIDWERAEWVIPAGRMKGKAEHRQPLSPAAVNVLEQARELGNGEGLIFPSPMKQGQPLSDMTMRKILLTAGLADKASVHGFRSSFRDWAQENTRAVWAVMEMCLAHAVGSDVVRSYARSELLDQKRELLNAWADFVTEG